MKNMYGLWNILSSPTIDDAHISHTKQSKTQTNSSFILDNLNTKKTKPVNESKILGVDSDPSSKLNQVYHTCNECITHFILNTFQ